MFKLFFHAKAGIVLNLFLKFEQKWASWFYKKKSSVKSEVCFKHNGKQLFKLIYSL